MKNIIVFAGSDSDNSINKQLATFASSLIDQTFSVEVLDLNDFKISNYSVNTEQAHGIDENAKRFYTKLEECDGIIISLAEHNGAYTSVFKSLFDWLSRINVKLFQGKPLLLMSTSPGPRGGQSVFEMALDRFPRHDAIIVAKFILPSFNDNFKDGALINTELNTALKHQVNLLETAL